MACLMQKMFAKMLAVVMLAGLMNSFGVHFGAAQIVQLGGSDGDIKAMLTAQGYDRIDVVERGLSSATYQACLGADRMQLKVYWDGRINAPQKIGGCRIQISVEQAARLLEKRGYDRVSVEDRGGSYTAVACKQGTRVRVEISMNGDIGAERVLGRCEAELTPADLTAVLEAEGYDRIEFKARQGQRLTALACLDDERFELVLSRSGEIIDSRSVGECERAITAADLPSLLAKKGYDRVVVTDPRLPRYKVEACRAASRVELIVNRYGEVRDEVRIGACPPPATSADITEGLRVEGYKQIKVTDNGPAGFVATACKNQRRHEFLFNRYAEVVKERELGRCSALSMTEVLEGLKAGGLNKLSIFAEGCRAGRRVRVLLNEFGEEVSRERIGPC